MSHANLTSHDIQAHDYPPDRGCEIAPRCLSCPLPRCKWDAGRAVEKLTMRDIRMLDLHREGLSDGKIAKRYSIADVRIIQRNLARARLYERAVGISPSLVVRENANRDVDGAGAATPSSTTEAQTQAGNPSARVA